jgi:Toc86/159 family protein import component
VKFLRLIQRVNFSLEDSLVSKVLCRLVADIGRRSNQEFVISSAKILAKKLEEDSEDDLDFSLNILVLGKSGVGKSATINSIFGDTMVMTDAFEPSTTSIKEVSGTIDGVKIRILDTPGLRSPMNEQAFNRKILSSVKRYMKKFPLDVILYVDRVDIQTTDLNDLPILRTITSALGPSIWQHTILTLTHAASTSLDGPSGSPLSYEVLVAQKSYLVQQSIIKAVGDQCQLSSNFMCPVSLIENHPFYGKNIFGESVLPNGLRWRSQLLALCFSLKSLSQVSSVSVSCTMFDHWKQFFLQDHSQPLCHLCSCLLQSPAHHLKFTSNWN